MKKFETPIIEIIAFESQDVIAASNSGPVVDDEGYYPVVKPWSKGEKRNMNNYNKPEIEVIKFEAKDVIAGSTEIDNSFGDATDFVNL